METQAYEVNFDGIVGPSHHYAGLSYGNVASTRHEGSLSHPREAALQGLKKMKFLHDLGIKQAVLPPHPRPDISTLRKIPYHGSELEILLETKEKAPLIFEAVWSASSMWTANAATVSPSSDTKDGRLHFTTANLSSKYHRSLEAQHTHWLLGQLFPTGKQFCQHPPLAIDQHYSDEGAANHTRLCKNYGDAGIEIFVFGQHSSKNTLKPKIFPARQSFEASEYIVNQHLLEESSVIFTQQNPKVIDAGVFHNDVISVGNRDFFFYHEEAFLEGDDFIKKLQDKFESKYKSPLHLQKVPTEN